MTAVTRRRVAMTAITNLPEPLSRVAPGERVTVLKLHEDGKVSVGPHIRVKRDGCATIEEALIATHGEGKYVLRRYTSREGLQVVVEPRGFTVTVGGKPIEQSVVSYREVCSR